MNRLKSPSAIAAIFVRNETFQSGGETIPTAIEIPPIDIGPVGILAIVCCQSELPLARPGGQGRATVSTRCGLSRSPPTPSLRRSVLPRSDGWGWARHPMTLQGQTVGPEATWQHRRFRLLAQSGVIPVGNCGALVWSLRWRWSSGYSPPPPTPTPIRTDRRICNWCACCTVARPPIPSHWTPSSSRRSWLKPKTPQHPSDGPDWNPATNPTTPQWWSGLEPGHQPHNTPVMVRTGTRPPTPQHPSDGPDWNPATIMQSPR